MMETIDWFYAITATGLGITGGLLAAKLTWRAATEGITTGRTQ